MKLAELFESTKVEKLKKKIAKLSKQYSDCDDFPTARGEFKAELDKARAELTALITETESEKDLLRLRAARGRPELERVKKVSKTMKDPNTAAKNLEHGFRGALKRDYKKTTKDE